MKIYLLSKSQGTLGVRYSQESKKAFLISFNSESESFFDQGLFALTELMKKTDVTQNPEINTVYIISNLLKAIHNENWKFWIATGKDSNGEDIDEHQLMMWKEFAKVWQEKGNYFVLKNLAACKVNDIVYNNKSRYNKLSKSIRDNNYYLRYLMDQAEMKFGPSQPEPQVYNG